jgi:RNA polymerase sigma-54 factor
MRLEAHQSLKLEQRMKLAPQIIQSIEILQLSALDLEELVQQEITDNPTLELVDGSPDGEAPEEGVGPQGPAEAASAAEATDPAADRLEGDDTLRSLEIFEEEWREAYAFRPRGDGGNGEDDRKREAIQNAPAPPENIQERLRAQLVLCELDARGRAIAETIIFNLDDAGYLPLPLEEIADQVNREAHGPGWKPVTVAEVEAVLQVVQSLDPPGVGARDLVECLLLQIPKDDPDLEKKRLLLREHLEDIHENRLPKIARETHLPLEEVTRLVGALGALDPRPGTRFSGRSVPSILPDVVVEYVDGRYEARLEESFIPRLTISRFYREMLERGQATAQVIEFIRGKIEAARRLISSIEQRRSTLGNIAREIVRFQQEFFDKGIYHLKPLKMQDVADKLGIHVSTVSRAISEKYMQTPRGIFPMKFFFTGGTETASGEPQSRVSVISRIRELVQQEDKSRPLSDSDIVERLKAEGLDIARRTVTKYRRVLKIPSSSRRRRF